MLMQHQDETSNLIGILCTILILPCYKHLNAVMNVNMIVCIVYDKFITQID